MSDADPGLMTIFTEALERTDPADRAAYLVGACAGDAALRRRVEALLAAHDGAGRFLEPDATGVSGPASAATLEATGTPAPETRPPPEPATRESTLDGTIAADPVVPPAAAPDGFVAGQVIAGRYTLLEVLGEGGMGTVYRAEQTRPVKRQVALKLIKVGMDSRVVLARFDAERQALALMDHPNIARVYDGGTTAAGQPFFVMELVKGVPITEFCDQHRLPVRARLELFVAVCQAVQHAHQKGIIHRDLKPSNVLVTEVDGRPTPKVIDFGVAKATEFQLTEQSLADTGAIVGTPTYMSPEQADPSSMDIDTRTDVYALGVILYELLAGSPPLDAKDFKRGAILEMLRMVREVDPPRPSTKVSTAEALPSIAASRAIVPAHLKRALRGDLDWIVMKALEKDRTRRYETANGFAADILRHLTNEPVVAAPPSRAYRMRKFVRKNRGRVIAASLVLAALIAGIVGTTLGLFQARQQERIAQTLATKEAAARGQAEDLATKEAKACGEAVERAEQLAREDYINRVSRAYREVEIDNVSLAEDLLHGCPPERRGWEWHYVKRLCDLKRLDLDVGESVNAVAFGADGVGIVSGSGQRTHAVFPSEADESLVSVWDATTGRRRQTPFQVKGCIYGVAVSPDGRSVAVASGFKVPRAEGHLSVWDAAGGQARWSSAEPNLLAMSVAFSPDGRSVAAGFGQYLGDDVGKVKVWDVATGRELATFGGPAGGVNRVAFHPDGRRLAVAGSGVTQIWDIVAGAKVRDLVGHDRWVLSAAFSPDGRWLATGGWDRTVKLWNADTGAEEKTIFAHEGYVLDLAFSPDGRHLVTTSEDRSVRLWEIPSGRRVATYHGHTDFVQAVAFRPDGRELASASLDGSVRVWNLHTSRQVIFDRHSGWVETLAFRRDGRRIVSLGGRGAVTGEVAMGWDPETGELDPSLSGVDFTAPSSPFVAGTSGRENLRTSGGTTKSADGKLVAQLSRKSGNGDASRSREYEVSSVVVRDATSGRVLQTLIGHTADVTCAASSPDGRRLVTASFDRTIKLWDTATGREIFTLRGHTAGVVALAFSLDGNRIASGGIDHTARVWDATPLPTEALRADDDRYRRKVATLEQLKAAEEDAQRAKILAGGSQWGMAAEAFARAIEKEPEKIQLRCQLVDALLQVGDRSRVGPASDDILKRIGNDGRSVQAAVATGVCRLARQAITDPAMRQAVHTLALATDELQQGLILGQYGQWDLAATVFTKHVEVNHSDDRPEALGCFGLQLLSLLEMGDLPGYRSASGKLVSQYSKTSDPNSLNSAAWFCTYAPDAVADLAVPVQMAEKALAGYPPVLKRLALNTLGAALYRAGRFDEAIARLDESVKASDGVGVPQDWAFLAMAHRKKGNDNEARSWLEKLRSHKPDEKAGLSTDVVECRMFLKEAEALLREPPPARP
jgi:eukaryotic-like serine/threonine-protein kinase